MVDGVELYSVLEGCEGKVQDTGDNVKEMFDKARNSECFTVFTEQNFKSPDLICVCEHKANDVDDEGREIWAIHNNIIVNSFLKEKDNTRFLNQYNGIPIYICKQKPYLLNGESSWLFILEDVM